MFEKFGEFDSAEEINRTAAAELAEGDLDAIRTLAEENGIESEDVQDFIEGCVDTFCTPIMAAAGKLEVEKKDLKLSGILADWTDMIAGMCAEDSNLAAGVRRKGKSLAGCMGTILGVAFRKKVQIDDRIVKAAPGKLHGPLYLYMPGLAEAKQLIRDYYLGGEK